MCGIVAGVSERNILPILIEGLKRLEYRGYDSAGVAVINKNNTISCVKEVGKVESLSKKLLKNNIKGCIGVAHTRWATHGEPSVRNAHPHLSRDNVAIVHNGIIENFSELRKELEADGFKFESDTDTEVIAHLISKVWEIEKDAIDNIRKVISMLEGAYGLAVLNKDDPESIIAVRSGSPIVIGFGINENYISSDSLSLLPVTNRFHYLDEGDITYISKNKVDVYDKDGKQKKYKIKELDYVEDAASKGSYKHFMHKEIFEQPEVVLKTFSECLSSNDTVVVDKFGLNAKDIFKKIEHIRIVACGTSYHAGMVAKYWLEGIAGVHCEVEVASELRYRKAVVPKNTLFVAISQSGETADTLAVLRQTSEYDGYIATLGICNVQTSSLVREVDLSFITRAGIEMGVASTKAFTTQLVSLLLLTCGISQEKGKPLSLVQSIIKSLRKVPSKIEYILQHNEDIEKISDKFVNKNHALFLGRGIHYPVALEGALKLKEISYIHAEAYPSGELKHGPLALVDENMPVITIAPNDALLGKLESNLQEVQARGGELYVFIDHAVEGSLNVKNEYILNIGQVDEVVSPIVFTVPLQLFSYHVAVQKGTDVDQPRNLAKSVTVE
jgi:glutamine---fructose-6-phosphate transaminase (isomerizing)